LETGVAFVDQFNKGMQRIMALRSPEIMAIMPQVEAMDFDTRVAIVKRGYNNLSDVLKKWKLYEGILKDKGQSRADTKRTLKNLRSARNHLDDAMRLADPKLPPQFKSQAEAAFNVLVACFIRDADNMFSALTGGRIEPEAFSQIVLAGFDGKVADMNEPAKVDVDPFVDVVPDGHIQVDERSPNVRSAPESDMITDLAIDHAI
jgi:hypothetical protein